jgi:glutathione S-transferase
MIQLIQFPWSPFCIAQRRILEYAQVAFKIVNIPINDRSLVWRLTKQRYYQVPIIKDRRTVVFEIDETSQVIAKYLDSKFNLGLFPRHWAGLQHLLWLYVENEIEGLTFKLNDIYFEERVAPRERLGFIRHKERKFGRGCLEKWRDEQPHMLSELARHLTPFEQMLATRPFLLEPQPRFVDFDLFGMLGNFLYSGHYELPALHNQLKRWYERMAAIRCQPSNHPI